MQEPHPLPDARAQLRAQLLLDVLAGRKTARQAAAALGVSRKTWHEWQQRGLEGMLDALMDRPTGRPAAEPDPEKDHLQEQLRQMERQVAALEQSKRIQSLLRPPLPTEPEAGSKKKPPGPS